MLVTGLSVIWGFSKGLAADPLHQSVQVPEAGGDTGQEQGDRQPWCGVETFIELKADVQADTGGDAKLQSGRG